MAGLPSATLFFFVFFFFVLFLFLFFFVFVFFFLFLFCFCFFFCHPRPIPLFFYSFFLNFFFFIKYSLLRFSFLLPFYFWKILSFPSFFFTFQFFQSLSFFFHCYFIIFVLIRWPPLAQVSPPAILPGGLSFGLFLLSSAEGFVVLHSFRLSLLICTPCIVLFCFIQSFRLSFFAVFSLFGWVFLIFTCLFVFLYSSSGLGEYCSTKCLSAQCLYL